jgi:hypothetical protein
VQQAISLPNNVEEDVEVVFIRYGRIASKDDLCRRVNFCEDDCIKLITEFLRKQ